MTIENITLRCQRCGFKETLTPAGSEGWAVYRLSVATLGADGLPGTSKEEDGHLCPSCADDPEKLQMENA